MPKRYQTNVRIIIIHETIDTRTHKTTNAEVANIMLVQDGVALGESIKLIQKVLKNVEKS